MINKLDARDAYNQIKMARLILSQAIDLLGELDFQDKATPDDFGLMQDKVIEASDTTLRIIEVRLEQISRGV